MKLAKIIVLFSLTFILNSNVSATETNVMIRAKAVDAKYIGTSVGGVRVIAEDAETGEILDQGWIKGATGSTSTLVEQAVSRGQKLTDDKTAGFIATLDLSSPRLVRFKVIGPYGFRQSLQEASVTSWIIPGKDILGDGITLTMPGFIVDAWTQVLADGKVDIYTKATMLCGCPIYQDGPWDPDSYEATAIIMQNDIKIGEVTLDFSGNVSTFSGSTVMEESGHYKAIVYLFDKDTGNVGVDRAMFEINLEP